MKRFLWILLLAGATALSSRAQSTVITGPTNPISASGAITVTGTYAGATSVSVTVTYLPTNTAVVSNTAATLSSGVWSLSFTPTALGDYYVRAVPSSGSTTGTANTATLVVTSIAPTISLAVGGGEQYVNEPSANPSYVLLASVVTVPSSFCTRRSIRFSDSSSTCVRRLESWMPSS
jgi:hypothetical protein